MLLEIKAQIWANYEPRKYEVVCQVTLDGKPTYTGPFPPTVADAPHTVIAPDNPVIGGISRLDFKFKEWWNQLTDERVEGNTLNVPSRPEHQIWWATYDGPIMVYDGSRLAIERKL